MKNGQRRRKGRTGLVGEERTAEGDETDEADPTSMDLTLPRDGEDAKWPWATADAGRRSS